MKAYKGLNKIPQGVTSDDKLIHGCLVVEGGALRTMYAMGAMDALMMNDINLDCYIGVSAGAMAGVNYLAGQIGRGAYLTLKYRPDSRFIGAKAIIPNKGITGFRFMWGEVQKDIPLRKKQFNNPDRRYVCVATNLFTGKEEYFEKDVDEDFLFYMQAGATVPFGSLPVWLHGTPYMDGGISRHVPVGWAIKEGYEKIVVIRTRERSFKAKKEFSDVIVNTLYKKKYPKMATKLRLNSFFYNKEIDEMNRLEASGRIFQLTPSKSLELTMFCNDLEELGDLYFMGLEDTKRDIDKVKEYLGV